jgi:2-iminoacetate synthase
VTKMSAGVSTSVGSHSDEPSTSQFEIADTRSVDEMKSDLIKMGFQPVMHDWNRNYVADSASLISRGERG